MKRKFVYVASLSILALGLASCSNYDYLSHDFEIEIPEKNSNATKEVDESISLDVKSKISEARDSFFEKYKSVIFISKTLNDDNGLSKGLDTKFIMDFTNNSIYYYKHIYTMKDGEIQGYGKFESKAFLSKDNTYTVLSEILFENYEEDSSNPVSKISGSKKFFTVHENINVDLLKRTQRDSSILSMDFYASKIYTNDDYSYLYSSSESKVGNIIEISENGLITYHYLEAQAIEGVVNGKLALKEKNDYLDKSILESSYDTTSFEKFVFDKTAIDFSNGKEFYDAEVYWESFSEEFKNDFIITQ